MVNTKGQVLLNAIVQGLKRDTTVRPIVEAATLALQDMVRTQSFDASNTMISGEGITFVFGLRIPADWWVNVKPEDEDDIAHMVSYILNINLSDYGFDRLDISLNRNSRAVNITIKLGNPSF